MSSGHFRKQAIARFAQQILALVIARSMRKPPRNRRWGYLRICKRQRDASLQVIFFAPIGTVNPARAARYRQLAMEKILRLLSHPEHQSSWQSRNSRLDRWGGAVVIGDFYLSFSGLPQERADEAIVLLLARGLGIADRGQAETIARLSRNNPALKLLAEDAYADAA